MKKCLLLLLSLSLSTALGNTYSNLIVFGDSQSDIGNMPESSNAGMNRPFYYNGIPYNLYVPFSNPVYGDQDTATDKLFHHLFNASDLPSQPLINQTIRAGRSVNWAQYLFVSLKAKGQLESDELVPWVTLYEARDARLQNASVDYAFAGALSNDHCADEGYTEMPDAFCTPQAIFNTQNIYRQHPHDDDLRRAIAVPGVQKQIALFSEDLRLGRVHVNTDTLYIIWAGANDLTKNFLNLLHGTTLHEFYQNMTETIPLLNDAAIDRLYVLGARHIVIISQQNLGLTPEASLLTHTNQTFVGRYLNAYALNLLVLRYNVALSAQIIQLQKRYPDLFIHFVNLQPMFNRLSFYPGAPFYKHLGMACQNKDAATYKAVVRGDLVMCTDYLYWNRAHMTYQGNRLVAEEVLKDLQK